MSYQQSCDYFCEVMNKIFQIATPQANTWIGISAYASIFTLGTSTCFSWPSCVQSTYKPKKSAVLEALPRPDLNASRQRRCQRKPRRDHLAGFTSSSWWASSGVGGRN